MIFLQTRIVLHGKNVEEIVRGLNDNLAESVIGLKEISDGAECVFEDCEKARKAVDKTVREYIVRVCEPGEIKRIINKGYDFFDYPEKRDLEKYVINAIENEEDIHDRLFVLRRNRIIEKVSNGYFSEKNEMNLEGFSNFRLKNYYNELEELVSYSADAFVMRREYEEFMSLLKTYLSVQPHVFKCLNIVVAENREYIFFDNSGRNISKKLEAETIEEFGRNADSDDLLVNVLINKNPQKVIIHNRKFMKREIFDTIKAVFGNNCEICDGCPLCRK